MSFTFGHIMSELRSNSTNGYRGRSTMHGDEIREAVPGNGGGAFFFAAVRAWKEGELWNLKSTKLCAVCHGVGGAYGNDAQ